MTDAAIDDIDRTATGDDPRSYFAREPLPKQLEAWRAARYPALSPAQRIPVDAHLLEMEQRTRKTAVVLAIAAARYEAREIDALCVVAWPSGVARNWEDEVAVDLPARVPRRVVTWYAGKADTVRFKDALEELIAFKGLAVLAVNSEAIRTKRCRAFMERFLAQRKVLFVGDETSGFMKSPGADTTKAMLKLRDAPGVVARLALDGTPVGEGPLDLFAPLAFLDPRITGHKSFYTFKARYAEYDEGYDPRTGRKFPKLKRYVRTDELRRKMDPFTFSCTRKDMYGDRVEKVYDARVFDLSDQQRSLYDTLSKEYRAEIEGGVVNADSVLTRYLRLQQVASGYVPTEATGVLCPDCMGAGEMCGRCGGEGVIVSGGRDVEIPGPNPRLEHFAADVERDPRPGIVWTRFRRDAEKAIGVLYDLGRRPVRYDGSVGPDEKARNKAAFQAGDASDFVGSPVAAGRGVNLTAGRVTRYYSHYWALLVRLQSEDRPIGARMDEPHAYVDFRARSTVEDRIVAALRSKKSLSEDVRGRPRSEWFP